MERPIPTSTVALLFLAFVALSQGQKSGGSGGSGGSGELEVAWGAPLVVECALRPEQRAAWRLDGGAVPPDMRGAEAAPARPDAALRARLAAPAARAHHAGVYSCAPDSPRLRVRVTGTPAAGAAAEPAAAADDGAAQRAGGLVYFEYRGNFTLSCADLAADPSVTITWSKNGTALEQLPELARHVKLAAEGGVAGAALTLAERAHEDDWGNYSCAAGGAARTWAVHARPIAKLPSDTNVVEGQKLKLSCKIHGMPLPAVEWSYSNSSDNASLALPVAAAFGERVSVRANEQGVPDGELSINVTQRADAGWFFCTAEGGAAPAATRLRVKDMYAALWPFLGICAEVFVLCAIILVYEKRRTKPELDDSDTDNHDQKKS